MSHRFYFQEISPAGIWFSSTSLLSSLNACVFGMRPLGKETRLSHRWSGLLRPAGCCGRSSSWRSCTGCASRSCWPGPRASDAEENVGGLGGFEWASCPMAQRMDSDPEASVWALWRFGALALSRLVFPFFLREGGTVGRYLGRVVDLGLVRSQRV